MQMNEAPILICYDGSPGAVRAIGTVAALLGPRRAVVLDVASSMSVAESVAAPHSAMIGAALEQTQAEVIVVGSRALRGLNEALHGSFSHQIAEHAGRPVLIVPPPDKRGADANGR